MLDPTALVLFMTAAFVLLVTPGPAVLYIVAQSVDQGRRAGMASVLGIEVGSTVHVLAATFGLSALLLSSATAFTVVKYLGAAYLIYLGLRSLLRSGNATQVAPTAPRRLHRIAYQGFIVNLLNPKTALFFLAFLPQFVDPSRGSITSQVLQLGFIFVAMAACSDSLYALLAGTAGHWLRGNPAFSRMQHRLSAGIYVTLGLTAALSGPDRA